jgi:hypothetical protein
MVGNYKNIFGELPKQIVTSPLDTGDLLELDLSEIINWYTTGVRNNWTIGGQYCCHGALWIQGDTLTWAS